MVKTGTIMGLGLIAGIGVLAYGLIKGWFKLPGIPDIAPETVVEAVPGILPSPTSMGGAGGVIMATVPQPILAATPPGMFLLSAADLLSFTFPPQQPGVDWGKVWDIAGQTPLAPTTPSIQAAVGGVSGVAAALPQPTPPPTPTTTQPYTGGITPVVIPQQLPTPKPITPTSGTTFRTLPTSSVEKKRIKQELTTRLRQVGFNP